MLWAAISTDGKSDLVRFNENMTARRYRTEALQPALITYKWSQLIVSFMHYNVPGHRAHAN